MNSEWSIEWGEVAVRNSFKGKMYELTVDTPDFTATFVRKVYNVAGLDPQWHYDYLARIKRINNDFHGYTNIFTTTNKLKFVGTNLGTQRVRKRRSIQVLGRNRR